MDSLESTLKKIDEYKYTVRDILLLSYILKNPGCDATMLKNYMDMPIKTVNVNMTIRKLIVAGLVEDRRLEVRQSFKHDLYITPKGAKIIEHISS